MTDSAVKNYAKVSAVSAIISAIISVAISIVVLSWGISKDIREWDEQLRADMRKSDEQLRADMRKSDEQLRADMDSKIDRLDDKIESVRGELAEVSKVVYRIEGLLEGRQIGRESGG